MGRVAAPFGVRGWVKVHAYTEQMENLLNYPVWWLGHEGAWREYTLQNGGVHGKSLLAQLEGVTERNAAELLKGSEIAVPRQDLPQTDTDEFYWNDLIGLRVVNSAGVDLGEVTGLLETGANDVLVVQGEAERLIPFVDQVILGVDLAARIIKVEWGADY